MFNLLKHKISKKKYLLFFLIGLILRLVASFGYGDADMEHFKSWAVLTNKVGLIRMYSKSDAELIKYSKEKNVSIVESFNKNRNYIKFTPQKNYWRTKYMVMYPPISEVFLYSSGYLHYLMSKNFENNRQFNFLINLPLLILGLFIFYILNSSFNSNVLDSKYSIIPFVYWLNPIFILDSPVQGYNNTLILLLCLLAFLCYLQKKNVLVIILGTIIFWSKPQGILLYPLFCYIIYSTTSSKTIAIKKIVFSSLLASVVVLIIPLINGYCISYILGSISAIFSLDTWSITVLSARSWNIWWLISYFDSGLNKMEVPISTFNQIHSIKVNIIANLIFLSGILYFSFLYYKFKIKDIKSAMFLFLGSLFCYNMLMLNVQYNQFIIFIPFVLYFAIVIPDLFYYGLAICFFYFSQIFYYGGLGRDFGLPIGLIMRLNIVNAFHFFIIFFTLLIIIVWAIFFKKIYINLKYN